MKKLFLLLFPLFILSISCQKQPEGLYTLGLFQVNDAPTLNEARDGFIQALEDRGLRDDVNIRLKIRNGEGKISQVQRIAQEFVEEKVNMVVAFSTPCLQAALIATHEIPIVFASVANPYLAGAGKSATNHLLTVTGVSSRGPIKQSLTLIKEILPKVKRIGTLWTPSEINSEYYLELAMEGAKELGIEIVSVPIANKTQVLHSAQVLINKKIEAIYQISDNTINASFGAVGRVAEENAIPLFGGFPRSTHLGACAAMGWDFFDMGYKAGQIAIQIKNGKNPGAIPIQYMKKVRLYLNMQAAAKQGIQFSAEILKRTDEVISNSEDSQTNSDNL